MKINPVLVKFRNQFCHYSVVASFKRSQLLTHLFVKLPSKMVVTLVLND